MERYFQKIPKLASSSNIPNIEVWYEPSTSGKSEAETSTSGKSEAGTSTSQSQVMTMLDKYQSDNDEQSHESETSSVPKKKKMNTPKRKYRSEWMAEFPWIIQKLDSIYCKYCPHKSITLNRSHLRRHQRRVSHQNKMKISRETVDVSLYLRDMSKKDLLSDKIKQAEYKLTMALVEHNIPFLFMDHLPQLLKQAIPDSEIVKSINCARTKTTAMVKAMADESKTNLTSILKITKFSIIIDETTDISVNKCLAILVRYVSIEQGKVRDQLLSLINIADLTAAGIVSSIRNILENLQIPTSNIIGFAADTASVMMGNFNGVQAKLKEIIPNIFVIGCICHSMALCASNAANKLPKEIEDFVRNVYNYLSGSSKRLQEYKEFQDFVAVKPHKLLRLSQTRWLSLEAVVTRILEQWEALRLYFVNAVLNDNLGAAQSILEGLENNMFKLYLTFLSYIIPLINKINVEFQSEKPKLHVIYDRISTLYRTILKNYMKKSFVDQVGIKEEEKIHLLHLNPMNVKMYLSNEDIYLGEECSLLLLKVNLNKNDLNQFKNYCLSYYIELSCQIKSRFQNLKIYENFGLLNPRNLLEDTVSLTPLLNEFLHLTNENVKDIGSEGRQISSLPAKIKEKLEKLQFQEFWFELYGLKNSDDERVFGNICHFVFNLMCLPHSSAAAERTFSSLNLIKTKTRNRLLPETCNALLLSKELLNDGACYNWEPSNKLLNQKVTY